MSGKNSFNFGKLQSRGSRRSGVLGEIPGLGASDAATLKACLSCSFASLPVTEFVTWTMNLPINDTQLNQTFGNATIDLLNDDTTIPGVTAVDTSFIKTGILQTDILVVGFGVHLYGEPKTFTAIGNSLSPVPSASVPSPGSPDVFLGPDIPTLLGTAGTPSGTGLVPAVLKWGSDTWEALWNMANAYRLNWIVRQKHYLVDEMVSDVCHYGSYADGYGFGTAEEPVLPYARFVNDSTVGQGGTSLFVPINARRSGSAAVIGGAAPAELSSFHPTRDFDLAPIAWGGVRNQSGRESSPFRKLVRPCILRAGIPIGLRLALSNGYHQQRMLGAMSISGGVGSPIGTGAVFNGTAFANLGSTTQALPELTLDPTPVKNLDVIDSSRTIYKGGAMQAAMLIKGFEIPEGMTDDVVSALGAGGAWTPASASMT